MSNDRFPTTNGGAERRDCSGWDLAIGRRDLILTAVQGRCKQ